MEPFPFTDAEWAELSEAARSVVNATLAGDTILHESHLSGLADVLGTLRLRYGDHPVLLETEADFASDDAERLTLYHRAARIAEDHGLLTVSIRLSLARLLLEVGDSNSAARELLACQEELADCDKSDQVEWLKLMTEARPEYPGTSSHHSFDS